MLKKKCERNICQVPWDNSETLWEILYMILWQTKLLLRYGYFSRYFALIVCLYFQKQSYKDFLKTLSKCNSVKL